MSDVSDDPMTDRSPRYSRRLSDKILIAFHQACDQRDFEVAERLLKVLDSMIAVQRRAAEGSGHADRSARAALATSPSRRGGLSLRDSRPSRLGPCRHHTMPQIYGHQEDLVGAEVAGLELQAAA
jgi:hypothetical protein